MINSEFIFDNIEKFDIHSSQKEIFEKIVNNIEKDKKILIAGDQLSGKSFFSRKLALALKEKLKLDSNQIIIYDYPLIILEIMVEQGILDINNSKIKKFLDNNNLHEILKFDNHDLIILDEINSTIFADLIKYEFEIKENQIIILVCGVRGLYLLNKKYFDEKNFQYYHLQFPSLQDKIKMLKQYQKLSNTPILNFEEKTSSLDNKKFKSLIT